MIGLNLSELEVFIQELNELLQSNKQKFVKLKPSTLPDYSEIDEQYKNEILTETESKVYIKLSHYFRLLTITVPNLSVAYEIWLKGILEILLDEVGLSFENWDRICTIGDLDSILQDRVDYEWTGFLEELQNGHINAKVWALIQKGKKRSDELIKRRIIRKKRIDF